MRLEKFTQKRFRLKKKIEELQQAAVDLHASLGAHLFARQQQAKSNDKIQTGALTRAYNTASSFRNLTSGMRSLAFDIDELVSDARSEEVENRKATKRAK